MRHSAFLSLSLAILAVTGACRSTTSPVAPARGKSVNAADAVDGAETRPSGYVEPRLAAHREQLKKLAGASVVGVDAGNKWRERREERPIEVHTAAAGLGGKGDAERPSLVVIKKSLIKIEDGAAAAGEAAGAGGLGLRGTGPGGGGEEAPAKPAAPPDRDADGIMDSADVDEGGGYGAGYGSAGVVVGHGAGGVSTSAAAPEPPAYSRRALIHLSDDTVEGELAKPEGAHLKARARTKHDEESPALAFAERERAQLVPLRAGSTDDNSDFDAFLKFIDERTRESVPAGAMRIDVSGRRFIGVVDGEGRALPTAELVVRDARSEAVLATAATYGDGRAPFYPRVNGGGAAQAAAPPPGPFLVEVSHGGRAVATKWDGAGDVVVRLPSRMERAREVPVDALFILDTTGSMSDEIQQIKRTLLEVTRKVRGLSQGVDLRWGAVLYRDVGDAYVTATRDFTGDAQEFDDALKAVHADGGGDTPESLNQGLSEGMVGVHWRPQAAKVAFLIADAPPHMDYQDDVPYGESLKDAVTLGVRIHAVAASGLADDPAGSLVFRQIAQYARGRFIFIEYGGDVGASGEAHGVSGAKQSNNLDDILYREIEREVNEWAR